MFLWKRLKYIYIEQQIIIVRISVFIICLIRNGIFPIPGELPQAMQTGSTCRLCLGSHFLLLLIISYLVVLPYLVIPALSVIHRLPNPTVLHNASRIPLDEPSVGRQTLTNAITQGSDLPQEQRNQIQLDGPKTLASLKDQSNEIKEPSYPKEELDKYTFSDYCLKNSKSPAVRINHLAGR